MNRPLLLLRQTRENLTETEFYGFIVFCSAEKEIKAFPDPAGYPFFHRSCAKPLQAALADELGTIGYFNLTAEEIAICCACNSG